MDALYLGGTIVAIGLGAYLVFALICAEEF
jgi:K+-transporting ATPase KdpF subunit